MTALAGACMKSEPRLSVWFPKLVPKHVTEAQFWNNYFSHVEYLIAQDGNLGRDSKKSATAAAAASTVPSSATGETPSQGGRTESTTPPRRALSSSNGSTTRTSSMIATGNPRTPPPTRRPSDPDVAAVTFDKRPFGIELVRNEQESFFPLVQAVERATYAKGVRPGHLLVGINGEPVQREDPAAGLGGLLGTLKSAQLPMTLHFWMPTRNAARITPVRSSASTPLQQAEITPTQLRMAMSRSAAKARRAPTRDATTAPTTASADRPRAAAPPASFDIKLPAEPAPPARAGQAPVRWGIVGVGDVCRLKSGPAFAKCTGSALEAVMRRNEKRAKEFGELLNCKWTASADDLIHDPRVTAVYVASPPGTHLSIALKVCKAGKPCLLEKPMARSYQECYQIVDAFKAAGLPLYVAYYRRGHDRWMKARQVILDGLLGRVTSVDYRLWRGDHLQADSAAQLGWRVDAKASGGGIFMDMGCHVVDILQFLLGSLSHVSGDAVRCAGQPQGSVETGVAMTFRTASGAVGTANFNFASGKQADRLTIVGTRGVLSMSVFGSDPPVLETAEGKRVTYPVRVPEHAHQPMIQRLVNRLRGCAIPEGWITTGEQAMRTASIIDAVLRKFYRARDDEFWTRKHTWQ